MHSIFGTKHLILMAICAAAIVLGYLVSRKWDLEKLTKYMFSIGVISELIKVFYYIIANEAVYGGILPKTDLPFHLCSIQILFVAIVRFTNSQKIKELLLSFMIPSCLFGGIAAILIATTSSLNGMPILSLQYFGYHSAIVIFALVLLTSGVLQLTIRHYVNCLKFLVGLMLFAIYINSILYDGNPNINFMYVASPPQAGLPWLNEDQGWLVYMLRYSSLVVGCVTLCYIKPIYKAIRAKFCKASV
jgi:uncharacterized membrane protein YwaF